MAFDTARRWLTAVPGLQRFARSTPVRALRHRVALHLENRQEYTFTQFVRLPSQLDALAGPVLDFVDAHHRAEPLRIVVIGCSTGAEPYTLSSTLLERCPGLVFTIDAYDVAADVLEVARTAAYPTDWVLRNPLVGATFVARTFDQDGDHLIVKREVAQHIRFHLADATKRLDIPAADIVIAQNVMCNLRRGTARQLFDNAAQLLKPRAALFVDGMDLDMREQRTRAHRLTPLTFALRRIHDEARLVRGERYPWHAAGLEPFSPRRRNGERRYATIFLRGAEAG